MGVAAVLEVLKDKASLKRNLAKIAKVFVTIERAATASPMLGAAIEAARQK